MNLFRELGATWLDALALLSFLGGWIGYAAFAARHGRAVSSLHNRMDHFRREWM